MLVSQLPLVSLSSIPEDDYESDRAGRIAVHRFILDQEEPCTRIRLILDSIMNELGWTVSHMNGFHVYLRTECRTEFGIRFYMNGCSVDRIVIDGCGVSVRCFNRPGRAIADELFQSCCRNVPSLWR